MRVIVFARLVLCLVTVNLFAQPNDSTSKNEGNPTPYPHASAAAQNDNKAADETKKATSSPPWYASSEWWLVIIAGLTGAAIAYQAREMTRTTRLIEGQLKQATESSERQLRAYVTVESGTIWNIANPVPIFLGQIFLPTGAEITNQGSGPGTRIQIKNTGQTPAYEVRHWGNICFREYPLISDLPPRATGLTPVVSVLGPGIISTKILWMPHPLTPEETADLRAGSRVIYVYGEITYTDTFGKPWYTRYRSMHHPSGGAIGVSTDLTFTEAGNEAT